jgi:hypothetical protein
MRWILQNCYKYTEIEIDREKERESDKRKIINHLLLSPPVKNSNQRMPTNEYHFNYVI